MGINGMDRSLNILVRSLNLKWQEVCGRELYSCS